MEIFGISIGADQASDESALSDVTLEERDRYLAWWRKFKMLDRLNWLGIGFAVLSPVGSHYYPSHEWNSVMLLGLILYIGTRIWLRVLTCPRCGVTYSGGLITVIQRFSSLSKCYGCDLSQKGLRMLDERGY